jgi:hypothetical protein
LATGPHPLATAVVDQEKENSTIWRPSFAYITSLTTVQLLNDVGHSGKAVMHCQTSTPLLSQMMVLIY